MKAVLLVVLLACASCQSQRPAASSEQRIEELGRKARQDEAEQKRRLDNDRRIAEGERKVAEQQQAESKAALQRHKEDKK